MTRNMRIVVVVLICVATGCTSSPNLGTIERNRGALQEADGSFAFYAGKGTGDALAKGIVISEDFPTAFMRLRVPATFVEAAGKSATRIRTVSFEAPDSTIEATVHFTDKDNNVMTLYFRPGDPWVTGYAQVGTGPDGFTMGFFDVLKWSKEATGTMPGLITQHRHTTGLLPDDNTPPLKYFGDPSTWPALPENWK